MATSNQQQPISSTRLNHNSSLEPTQPPKMLVLCFDGTSNSFGEENTNVVRLFNALEKHKTGRQMCYYQPGIGTYLAPTAGWSPALQSIAKAIDMAFAWYLEWHIMGGYKFLMENYSAGDKICLFGFSRGAYTARCLAGMLHKVGLLPKSNEEQIPFAYKKYKDSTPNGRTNAKGFKSTFSRDVEIEFLGVWDTVDSVGVFCRHLPFTASNTIIRTFRHALALDEHRAKFRPNPYHRVAPSAAAARFDPDRATPVVRSNSSGPRANIIERVGEMGKVTKGVVGDIVEGSKRRKDGGWRKRWVTGVDTEAFDSAAEVSESEFDDEYYYGNYHGSKDTDVKEVWFAGCHADVGGGSVHNNKNHTLANPSLVWMVNEILASGVPIVFKERAFEDMPPFNALTIKLPRERISDPIHKTATPHRIVGDEAIEPSAANGPQLDRTTSPLFSAEHETGTHDSKLPQGFILATAPPEVLVASPAPMTPPRAESPQPPSAVLLPTAATTITTTERSPGSDHPALIHVSEDDPRKDANARMYDQLERKKIWWVLEWMPFVQYYQDKEGSWHKGLYWNRGRPREIQDLNPLFHSSVKLRENYTPRAILDRNAKVTYVD